MSIFARRYVRVVKRWMECCEGDDDGYVFVPQYCTVYLNKPFTYRWRDVSALLPGTIQYKHHAEKAAKRTASDMRATYLGVYDSTDTRPNLFVKLLQKIRKFFTGPQGEQGIPGMPGNTGPMGMRGPAYDDLQCPHCKYYRSQTGVGLLMEAEVGGVFSYQCRNKKCNEKSFWKPIEGLWVWQGPRVNPDDALR